MSNCWFGKIIRTTVLEVIPMLGLTKSKFEVCHNLVNQIQITCMKILVFLSFFKLVSKRTEIVFSKTMQLTPHRSDK